MNEPDQSARVQHLYRARETGVFRQRLEVEHRQGQPKRDDAAPGKLQQSNQAGRSVVE
jgi:hypothetical protein